MAWLVKTFDGNEYLLLDGVWRSKTDPVGARFLRLTVTDREYSVADGFPETLMAHKAAKMFGGGEVEWVGGGVPPEDEPPRIVEAIY